MPSVTSGNPLPVSRPENAPVSREGGNPGVAANEADDTRAILAALECERPSCGCHNSNANGKGPTHCPAHDDRNPSLSVSPPNRTVRPLLHCFAGCAHKDVLAALRERGLIPREVAFEVGQQRHYRQDSGAGHPKRMWWPEGAKPAAALYRAETLADLPPGTAVLVTEGETATEAAVSLGFEAVATVCGAASVPTREALAALRGFDVVLVPDNDDLGRRHMRRIAGELDALGIPCRWLEVPGLPEKGDLADYTGSRDDLEVLVAAAPKWEQRDEPLRFTILTRDDLLSTPEPDMLIDGVVPQPGVGLVYSSSGLGKSFVMLHMACCVATGLPWFGRQVVQGDVLYIAGEGQMGFKRRLRAWETRYGVEATRLFWVTTAPQFMNASDVGELLAALALSGVHPVLVVIDTLSRTLVGGDENSAKDVGLYLASLEELKSATAAAVWVVHHTGHNTQDRPRGSSTIMPAVDTLIALTGDKETHNLTLTCEKQKDTAEFEPIYVHLSAQEYDGNGFSLVAEEADESTAKGTLSANEQLALATLADAGQEGASTTAWMALCAPMPARSFYRAKAGLEAKFRVHNAGTERRTRWVLPVVPTTATEAPAPRVNCTAILPHPSRGGSSGSDTPLTAKGSTFFEPSDPHPCLDCGEPIVGAGAKCADCAGKAAAAWKASRR